MTNILRNIILVLIGLTALSTGYYLYDGIYAYPNSERTEKLFKIAPASNAKTVAFDLAHQKIIDDPYPLLTYLFLSGDYKNIKAGSYKLNSKMTGQQIAEMLVAGKTAQVKLTIIEGWDLVEVSEYLQNQGFGTIKDFYTVAGTPAQADGQDISDNSYLSERFNFLKNNPKSASLEGFIFPDTYYVQAGYSMEEVLTQILANFDSKLTSQMREDIQKQNKSIYEIITMASIIEKEVKTLDDKKTVSGILWKRLKAGQLLQADATVLYALQIQSANVVYKKYTEIDSPYNTYKYKGLPFGPISNPGEESILAAIYPTESKYWFYLSKPDGTTVFSRTYAEHVAAKNKYLN